MILYILLINFLNFSSTSVTETHFPYITSFKIYDIRYPRTFKCKIRIRIRDYTYTKLKS